MTQRQRVFPRRLRLVVSAILVGLLLGLAGPFGSYPAYPTSTRYVFWLGLTVAGVLAGVAAEAVLPLAWLRPGARRIAAVALVSALPMTFVVAWTISHLQQGRFFAPEQLPALFAAVATIQLLVVFVMTITAPPQSSDAAAPPIPPSPSHDERAVPPTFPSALLGRLPHGIGSDIIALETEDHYLRVHTSAGSGLILMRMADAVALLDTRLGVQVHRRWWVAEEAVTSVQKEGQNLYLRLTNDIVVPVGRTFSGAARARFAAARKIGPSQADELRPS